MLKEIIKKYTVEFILVFATFLFGVNPLVIKIGVVEMPPLVFTTLRLFVAVIMFLFFLIKSKTYKKVNKKDWKIFGIMGLGAFLFQIGMIYSLRYVSAATVATMIGIIPISVLIIHNRMKIREIKGNHYIGAGITFVGVFLISGLALELSSGMPSNSWKGILLLLMGQFAAASYTVASEKVVEKYSHYQISTAMFTIAFVLFLLISTPKIIQYNFNILSAKALFSIVYGGVVSLCIANNIWIWGISQIGSHKVAVYNNLPPIFAVISEMVIFHDIPKIFQLVGIGIILFGLNIFRRESVIQ